MVDLSHAAYKARMERYARQETKRMVAELKRDKVSQQKSKEARAKKKYIAEMERQRHLTETLGNLWKIKFDLELEAWDTNEVEFNKEQVCDQSE